LRLEHVGLIGKDESIIGEAGVCAHSHQPIAWRFGLVVTLAYSRKNRKIVQATPAVR